MNQPLNQPLVQRIAKLGTTRHAIYALGDGHYDFSIWANDQTLRAIRTYMAEPTQHLFRQEGCNGLGGRIA